MAAGTGGTWPRPRGGPARWRAHDGEGLGRPGARAKWEFPFFGLDCNKLFPSGCLVCHDGVNVRGTTQRTILPGCRRSQSARLLDRRPDDRRPAMAIRRAPSARRRTAGRVRAKWPGSERARCRLPACPQPCRGPAGEHRATKPMTNSEPVLPRPISPSTGHPTGCCAPRHFRRNHCRRLDAVTQSSRMAAAERQFPGVSRLLPHSAGPGRSGRAAAPVGSLTRICVAAIRDLPRVRRGRGFYHPPSHNPMPCTTPIGKNAASAINSGRGPLLAQNTTEVSQAE